MGRSLPDDWNTRRKEVYRRDGFKCQNCGRGGGPHGNVELHAHHIVPRSKGGTHKKSNLVTVCKTCHRAIHGDSTATVRLSKGNFSDRVTRAIERYYRTNEYDDGYVRLGKSDDKKASIQRRVDQGRNTKYGGCPSCGEPVLTVSWVGMGPGSKVKVVECESCSAQFDESVEKKGGTTQRILTKIEDPSELDTTGSAFLQELKNQVRLKFNL